MSRILLIVTVVITILLLAIGTVSGKKVTGNTGTPEGAVRTLFDDVANKDWKAAYSLISNQNTVDLSSFVRDMNGSNGDLRSFSTLAKATPKVLREDDNQAQVRADLQWSTAVGAIYDTKDLTVTKSDGGWKVQWPVNVQPKVPPQV